MSFFERIFHYAFGRKDNMTTRREFQPTDILYHRYQKSKVLTQYVKTLPDKFTDDDITIKIMNDGRIGLQLPRKLNKEEIDGALQAFLDAHRAGEMDDDE